jgi:hypothetical protein
MENRMSDETGGPTWENVETAVNDFGFRIELVDEMAGALMVREGEVGERAVAAAFGDGMRLAKAVMLLKDDFERSFKKELMAPAFAVALGARAGAGVA